MDRRRTVLEVAKRTFHGSDFVVYPDHPLLARGPDVLGVDPDGLLALFVYTSVTHRPRSRGERARLLLSRLALPRGTRFVLVAVADDQPLADIDVGLFDQVDHLAPNLESLQVERTETGVVELVEHLRVFHSERFAEAWTSRGAERNPTVRGESGPPTFSYFLPQGRHPRWIDVEHDGLVAELGRTSPLLRSVEQLAALMVAGDYGLSEGLSGIERTGSSLMGNDAHLALHRLMVERRFPVRARTGDPLKAYRAAAFAGARVEYSGAV